MFLVTNAPAALYSSFARENALSSELSLYLMRPIALNFLMTFKVQSLAEFAVKSKPKLEIVRSIELWAFQAALPSKDTSLMARTRREVAEMGAAAFTSVESLKSYANLASHT